MRCNRITRNYITSQPEFVRLTLTKAETQTLRKAHGIIELARDKVEEYIASDELYELTDALHRADHAIENLIDSMEKNEMLFPL